MVSFSIPFTAACADEREAEGTASGTRSRLIVALYRVVWMPFTTSLPSWLTVPAARRY